MKKIKQYWKEILIGIFVLFSMNKCVQSCNRASTISKTELEVDSLTNLISLQQSKIDSLQHEIDLLNKDVEHANSENENLKNSNNELTTIAKKNQEVKVIRVK